MLCKWRQCLFWGDLAKRKYFKCILNIVSYIQVKVKASIMQLYMQQFNSITVYIPAPITKKSTSSCGSFSAAFFIISSVFIVDVGRMMY